MALVVGDTRYHHQTDWLRQEDFMRVRLIGLVAAMGSSAASAVEMTMQNDSLVDASSAVVVTGFIAGGAAGSWLTSPCNGDVRAVQVFWRSQTGIGAQTIHQEVNVHRSGTFPTPGVVEATVGGPVLTDGVINEWRFLDENNVIPLIVPVTMGERIVVSIVFDSAPPASVGPSVVRDTNGIQPQRNAIFSNFGAGFEWRSSESLGVAGDWVIRAVVDCAAVAQEAEVAVGLSANPSAYTAGQPLSYTIVVDNAGPVAANGTTIVDIFPAAFTGASWTCSATGGASCTATGSGNITQLVNLPVGGEVVFDVNGIVAPGTTGTVTNTVTAVVAGGITDPLQSNNTATLNTQPNAGELFADGFED